MTLRGLWSWWNEVWFTPRPVTPIALYRIMFGLLVLQLGAALWPDLLQFFGERAIVSFDTALQWSNGPTVNALLLLPRDNHMLIAAFQVFMVGALFLTLGLFTRLSAIIVFLGLISITFRNPFILHSGDCFMRAAAFLLMLSPCGEAFSLDNLIKIATAPDPTKVQFPPRPPWAQRLLQFNLAAVYADAFWTKLASHQWLDGLAVYYAVRLDQFKRLPVPFLLGHLWACKLATWATLILEFCMWTLVWFRELRYWLLGSALLFHAGLDWTLNIPHFQMVMMSTLILFVDPVDLSRTMDRIKRLAGKIAGSPAQAVLDATSTAGLRTAEILRRLDMFGLIDVTNGDTASDIDSAGMLRAGSHIIVRDGDKWLHGIDAWRCLSARLPMLWIVYPLLALPIAHWLANRLTRTSKSVLES